MAFGILRRVQSIVQRAVKAASAAIARWTKPISSAPALATVADLGRTKS